MNFTVIAVISILYNRVLRADYQMQNLSEAMANCLQAHGRFLRHEAYVI